MHGLLAAKSNAVISNRSYRILRRALGREKGTRGNLHALCKLQKVSRPLQDPFEMSLSSSGAKQSLKRLLEHDISSSSCCSDLSHVTVKISLDGTYAGRIGTFINVLAIIVDVPDNQSLHASAYYDFKSVREIRTPGENLCKLLNEIQELRDLGLAVDGRSVAVSFRWAADYKATLMMYGLMQANSGHPCIFCEADSASLANYGKTTGRGLDSVEAFDPRMGEWRMLASMSIRRSSVGVGVVKGACHIPPYAALLSNKHSTNHYDNMQVCFMQSAAMTVNAWRPWNGMIQSKTVGFLVGPEMLTRRSGAGIGVLDNVMYAVGGHNGPVIKKSAEMYDAEMDVWRPIGDMSLCRRNAGVIALNGLLYAVGGDDGSSNLVSVEIYNPKTDVWSMLPSCMSIGRSFAGVAIINKSVP